MTANFFLCKPFERPDNSAEDEKGNKSVKFRKLKTLCLVKPLKILQISPTFYRG